MSFPVKVGELFRRLKKLSVQQFSKSHPNKYLLATLLFAITGYVFILIFPIVAITAYYHTYTLVVSGLDNTTIFHSILWFSLAVLCSCLTYSIASIRFSDPQGIELNDQSAAPLIKMIKDIEDSYRWPKIQKIVLTHQFELNITKVPVYGIPVWSRNVLVVGIQTLQTISAENFNSLLTQKLLQYSKRSSIIFNWINSVRDHWLILARAFHRRSALGDEILYGFFNIYSLLFSKFSIYAAQLDAMKADDLVLNHINDRDFFRAVEEYHLSKYFLRTYFWSKMYQLMKAKGTQPARIKPFQILPHAIEQAFNPVTTSKWLINLSHEQHNSRDSDPPFATRMHNIGYTKVIPCNKGRPSAAAFIFKNNYKSVAEFADKMWLKSMAAQSNKRNRHGNSSSELSPQTKLKVA